MCDGRDEAESRAFAAPVNALWLLLLLATASVAQGSGCERLPPVQNGWVNLTDGHRGSLPVGTVLWHVCDPGYTLDGPSAIRCAESGLWSEDPPRCERTDVCRPPFEPENGGYTCHPTPCRRLAPGTVIEYFCDEGYVLKGDYKYLTCRNGEWDSPMQSSCLLGPDKDSHVPLGVPTLSIVAATASSVALVLLLVVLFVLLQPKLKSFQSRREQGVAHQPASIVVEGVQVVLPSYEEAVHSNGAPRAPVVIADGQQGASGREPAEGRSDLGVTSGRTEAAAARRVPSPTSMPSSRGAEQAAAAGGGRPQWRESTGSELHSFTLPASEETYSDDIALLKDA